MKIYKKILIFSFIFFVQFNLIACGIMESDEEEMVGRYTLTTFHVDYERQEFNSSQSYLELTIDGDNHSGMVKIDSIHYSNAIKINDWFYESDKSMISIKYEGYSEYIEKDVVKHAEIIKFDPDDASLIRVWEK